MKRFYKLISIILAAVMITGVFAGCNSKGEEGTTSSSQTATAPEGALTDLIDKIYEKKDTGLAVQSIPVDLADATALKSFTGLDDASKLKEVVASEAMIGSQAYSMVLARLNNAGDAESVATAMKNGIDPAKWICVTADDLRVAACGDLVLLIMVSSELAESVTADEIIQAFRDLCDGNLTVDLK